MSEQLHIPEPVRTDGERALARLQEQAPAAADHAARLGFADQLVGLLGISEFLAMTLQRWPELLGEWAAEPDPVAARTAEGLEAALHERLGEDPDEATLMRELRRFRRGECARLLIRDLTGRADLDECLETLTAVADACILSALDVSHTSLAQRYGEPRGGDGSVQRLVVLGMGKLGGRELNFSSDIDLIFVYPEAGETDGDRSVPNEQFFVRQGQQLIRLLDQVTEDGFAYRVDLRLRPFGESGPLAVSATALENYYQLHGREWERYAAVKARAISVDHDAAASVEKDLVPFVYRRYLDFGVFDSLRDMKRRIDREVGQADLADHIKLGPGGIREIEFLAQMFQLIRGGREPSLRTRKLRSVFPELVRRGHLEAEVADSLMDAYRFLRVLENRLQGLADRQTHQLPDEELGRARLAAAMGHERWEALSAEIAGYRSTVSRCFHEIVVLPGEERVDTPSQEIWEGRLDTEADAERIRGLGYTEPDRVRAVVDRLRGGSISRMGGTAARKRLSAIGPALIAAAAEHSVTAAEDALERLVRVVEAIGRRSSYLALLDENPATLDRLAELCGRSSWITERVADNPLLLDELLDPRDAAEPPAREELAVQLRDAVDPLPRDDLEVQMEALRVFKQVAEFRIALADLAAGLPLMRVSDRLTDIAELVLAEVVALADAPLRAKHGAPGFVVDGDRSEARFLVVGYGKLGGLELSYGSDLDLVFLHDSQGEDQRTDGEAPVDNGRYFMRLGQRVIHLLTTPTHLGSLYETDMRLRPSGNSGLLVSSLEAFEIYQAGDAWTWEHQALLRARAVAGDRVLGERFERLRLEVLCRSRDPDRLREDVVAMRGRLRRESLGKSDAVRQMPGGLLDLEFLVQFLCLAHAADSPDVVRYSDAIRQLEALAESGYLDAADSGRLAEAYRALRNHLHRRVLLQADGDEPQASLLTHTELVAALWSQRMGCPAGEDPSA